MRRSFLVLIGLTVIVFISLAFTRRDDPWKNLKVLPKDITQKQMDSVMDHFTVSLNVDCGFCHVEKGGDMDYAADDNKHKLIARDMMVMTNEINDKYFDYTGAKRTINTQLMVTCYTCHNGQKMPETQKTEANKKSVGPWKGN
ncbi:MAG: c-type cytochrome [Flavisolibacter sp.]